MINLRSVYFDADSGDQTKHKQKLNIVSTILGNLGAPISYTFDENPEVTLLSETLNNDDFSSGPLVLDLLTQTPHTSSREEWYVLLLYKPSSCPDAGTDRRVINAEANPPSYLLRTSMGDSDDDWQRMVMRNKNIVVPPAYHGYIEMPIVDPRELCGDYFVAVYRRSQYYVFVRYCLCKDRLFAFCLFHVQCSNFAIV